MPCRTMQLPGGSYAIICGGPKPKQCAFCVRRSTKLCDWPVERPKVVPAESLKAGDRIFPFSSGKEVRTLIKVTAVPNPNWPGALLCTEVQWEWNGMPAQPLRLRPGSAARLAVKGTCDQPCCDNHHRHVARDTDYCQDHWKQEDIA